MKTLTRSVALIACAWLVSACGGAPPATEAPTAPEAPAAPAAPAAPTAEAPAAPAAPAVPAAPAAAPKTVEVTLEAKSGSKLAGKATFSEVEGGVKVALSVSGAPAGKVASHVHEVGDCSAPDGKSAGGHFNPAAQAHGLPGGTALHLGDLGNVDVAKDGTGRLEIVVKGANLKEGDASSFLGRSIIVHEKMDDGGQPTGNAGGRIGCGVIK
jgi:Cu-Zn family superoxide dismutase